MSFSLAVTSFPALPGTLAYSSLDVVFRRSFSLDVVNRKQRRFEVMFTDVNLAPNYRFPTSYKPQCSAPWAWYEGAYINYSDLLFDPAYVRGGPVYQPKIGLADEITPRLLRHVLKEMGAYLAQPCSLEDVFPLADRSSQTELFESVDVEDFASRLTEFIQDQTPSKAWPVFQIIMQITHIARILIVIFSVEGKTKHLLWIDVARAISDMAKEIFILCGADQIQSRSIIQMIIQIMKSKYVEEIIPCADISADLIAKYVKYAVTIIVMAIVYFGFNGRSPSTENFRFLVSSYSGVKTMTTDATNFVNEIWNDFFSSNSEVIKTITTQGETLLTESIFLKNAPNRYVYHDPSYLFTCRENISRCDEYVNKKYPPEVAQATSNLRTKLIAARVELQTHYHVIENERSGIDRVTTTPVLLRGSPGVGKSEFAKYVCRKVAEKLNLPCSIYNFTSTTGGNFHPNYYGEPFGIANEATNYSDKLAESFNTIASGDVCRLEGASLEQKSSLWTGCLFVITTNEDRIAFEAKIGEASALGSMSRLANTTYLIEDPFFDGDRNGGNFHRKGDFSHLKISRQVPVNPLATSIAEAALHTMQESTSAKLISDLTERVARNYIKFYRDLIEKSISPPDSPEKVIWRQQIEFMERVITPEPRGIPMGPSCFQQIRFEGVLGSGKTATATELANQIHGELLMPIHILRCIEDFEKPLTSSLSGQVYILDDVNFELEWANLNKYLQWSNKLQNTDIVIICTNNELPITRTFFREPYLDLTKLKFPVFVQNSGVWRRMGCPFNIYAHSGWCGSNDSAAMYKTGFGYVLEDQNGKPVTTLGLFEIFLENRRRHLDKIKELVFKKDVAPSLTTNWDLELIVRQEEEFLKLMSTYAGVGKYYAGWCKSIGEIKISKLVEQKMMNKTVQKAWLAPPKPLTPEALLLYGYDCMKRLRAVIPEATIKFTSPKLHLECYDGIIHECKASPLDAPVFTFVDGNITIGNQIVTPTNLLAIHNGDQEDIPAFCFTPNVLHQMKALAVDIYHKNTDNFYCEPYRRYKEATTDGIGKKILKFCASPSGKAITALLACVGTAGILYSIISWCMSKRDEEVAQIYPMGISGWGDASPTKDGKPRKPASQFKTRPDLISEEEFSKLKRKYQKQYYAYNEPGYPAGTRATYRVAIGGEDPRPMSTNFRRVLKGNDPIERGIPIDQYRFAKLHSHIGRAYGEEVADHIMTIFDEIDPDEAAQPRMLSTSQVINRNPALDTALEKINANLVLIRDCVTQRPMHYGLVLNERQVVTVNHSNINGLRKCYAEWTNSKGEVEDTLLELSANLYPSLRDGNIYTGSFKGFKSLSSQILANTEIPMDGSENRMFATTLTNGRLAIQPGFAALETEKFQYLRDLYKTDVPNILAYKYVGDRRTALPGDCGLPLIVPYSGTFKIAGFMCASTGGLGYIYYTPLYKTDSVLINPVLKPCAITLEPPTRLPEASMSDLMDFTVHEFYDRYSQERVNRAVRVSIPEAWHEVIFAHAEMPTIPIQTLNALAFNPNLVKMPHPKSKRELHLPTRDFWDEFNMGDVSVICAPAPIYGEGMGAESLTPLMVTPFKIRPAMEQIAKYAHKVSLNYNEEVSQKATTALIGHMQSLLQRKLRILGLFKALNGIEHLPSIVIKTSCGINWNKMTGKTTKEVFLERSPERGNQVWFKPNQHGTLAKQETRAILNGWTNGKQIVGVVADCEKPELMQISDVKAGKVRIFNVYDGPMTIALRAVFGEFNAFLIQNFMHLPTKIGFDPDVSGHLVKHPKCINPDDPRFRHISCDIKRMDKNMVAELIEKFGEIISHLYEKEEKETLKSAIFTLVNTLHIYLGNIYYTRRGNTSGNPVTTELNCIVAWFVSTYSLLKHLEKLRDPRYFEETTWNEMTQGMWLAAYGDDVHITVDTKVYPYLDESAIAEGFKDWGFDLEFSDVMTMVGRNIIMVKNTWCMPFKKQAIIKMLSWVVDTDRDNLITVVNSALKQAALYRDERFFEKCQIAARYICNVKKIPLTRVTTLSMEELIDETIRNTNEFADLLSMKDNDLLRRYLKTLSESTEKAIDAYQKFREENKTLIEQSINTTMSIIDQVSNPVSVVNELCQRARREPPVYRFEYCMDEASWIAYCTIGSLTSEGRGDQKKSAKTMAADKWLFEHKEDFTQRMEHPAKYAMPRGDSETNFMFSPREDFTPTLARKIGSSTGNCRATVLRANTDFILTCNDDKATTQTITAAIHQMELDLAKVNDVEARREINRFITMLKQRRDCMERIAGMSPAIPRSMAPKLPQGKPNTDTMVPNITASAVPVAMSTAPNVIDATNFIAPMMPRAAQGAAPTYMGASARTSNLVSLACGTFTKQGSGQVNIKSSHQTGQVLAILSHSNNKFTSQPMKDLLKYHTQCGGDVVYKAEYTGNAMLQGEIVLTFVTRSYLEELCGTSTPTTISAEIMSYLSSRSIPMGQTYWTETMIMKRVCQPGQPAALSLSVQQYINGNYDQDVAIFWVKIPPTASNSPATEVSATLTFSARFANTQDKLSTQGAAMPFDVRGYIPTQGSNPTSSNLLEGRTVSAVYPQFLGKKVRVYSDGPQVCTAGNFPGCLNTVMSQTGGVIPSGLTAPDKQRFVGLKYDSSWTSSSLTALVTYGVFPKDTESLLINTNSFKTLFTDSTTTPDAVLTSLKIYNEAGVKVIDSYVNTNPVALPTNDGATATQTYQIMVRFTDSLGSMFVVIHCLYTISDVKSFACGIPRGVDFLINPFLGTRTVQDSSVFATLPNGQNSMVITAMPPTTITSAVVGTTYVVESSVTNVWREFIGNDTTSVVDADLFNPVTQNTVLSFRYDPALGTFLITPVSSLSNYMSLNDDISSFVFKNVTVTDRGSALAPTDVSRWGNRVIAPSDHMKANRIVTVPGYPASRVESISKAKPRAALVADLVLDGMTADAAGIGAEAAATSEGVDSTLGTFSRDDPMRQPFARSSMKPDPTMGFDRSDPLRSPMQNPTSKMGFDRADPLRQPISKYRTTGSLNIPDASTNGFHVSGGDIGHDSDFVNSMISDENNPSPAHAEPNSLSSMHERLDRPHMDNDDMGAMENTEGFSDNIDPDQIDSEHGGPLSTGERQTGVLYDEDGRVDYWRTNVDGDAWDQTHESEAPDFERVDNQTPHELNEAVDEATGESKSGDATSAAAVNPENEQKANSMATALRDMALASVGGPIKIQPVGNVSPYSNMSPSHVDSVSLAMPRGSAISAPIQAQSNRDSIEATEEMHQEDIDATTGEDQRNRDFEAAQLAQQYSDETGLIDTQQQADSKTSAQNFSQNSALSQQGYQQNRGLATQSANLGLRNSLAGTAAGTVGSLVTGLASTVEQEHLQNNAQKNQVKDMNAEQQLQGVTTGALTQAAQ